MIGYALGKPSKDEIEDFLHGIKHGIELNNKKMKANDIKKALYKEKPAAKIRLIDKLGIHYFATIFSTGDIIEFIIPFNEIEEGRFYNEMEAKHLIRWIQY